MKTSLFLPLLGLGLLSQVLALPRPAYGDDLIPRIPAEEAADGTQIAEGWKRDEEAADGTQIAEGW